MNKTFKYAVSVVLGAAMVTPAFAQRDNFPDVQDTHWAFEAVARLKKEGIITGYPDGTFKGKQMITRYEMATLLYALYMNLKNVTDGLDAQIKALDAKVNEMKNNQGGGTAPDDQSGPLRDAINSLKRDVSSMKTWGDDITQLKKMSSTYEKELSQMGVDVEAMKKDLADLSKRVTALEGKKQNLAISGDANFFMGAQSKGNTGSGVLNSDGRVFGGTGTGAGLDTLTVLHELGLKFATTNETGSNVVAELVAGNMVGGGSGFINQSTTTGFNGAALNAGASPTSVYLNRLYATLNDGIGGLNFDAKIGRQGLHMGSFVVQRPDTTTFFSNERYDNGAYTMDGASFKFGLGANTALSLFLGQTSNMTGNLGAPIQPIVIGESQTAIFGSTAALGVARAMGGSLGFKIGENGKLHLTFVDLDSNTSANTPVGANRLEVYGADLDYKLSSNIGISAGTGRSQFKAGTSSVTFGNKNTRTNVGVNFTAGALGVDANYAEIGNAYVAPGDWNKVAIYHNLNDLKTTSIKAKYTLNDKISLHGGYLKGDQISVSNTDAVKSTTFGADFKINSNWSLMADYEDSKFQRGYLNDGVTPQFKFTTLGFGYDMGANTMFKLFYQNTDITGIGATSPLFGLTTAGAIKGATFGAQFSVKF